MSTDLYRIVPRFRGELPIRMQGTYSFKDAHRLCCEWNSQHDVREMAIEEPVEEEGEE